jgi:hypothetical protein
LVGQGPQFFRLWRKIANFHLQLSSLFRYIQMS